MEPDQNLEQQPDSKTPATSNAVFREILSWVLTVVVAVGVAWFITHVIIVNAKVPSGSMENTIMTDDRIVAFRLSYVFSPPKRFDVVVFPFPDDETTLFVKRIIGLPGETVEIKGGKVFIDGQQIDDATYLKEPPIADADVENMGPYVVPPDSYFMMGDNRNNSKDSRLWVHTFVDRGKILGKVFLKYYPQVKLIH